MADDKNKNPLFIAECKILGITHDNHRRLFARALQQSLKVDDEYGDEHPDPASPSILATRFGVGVPSLDSQNVVISRAEAVEFLKSLKLEMSLAVFSRRYTSDYYSNLFDRPISKAGSRHVFTYAEVLHLAELLLDVPVPGKIKPYLKSGN